MKITRRLASILSIIIAITISCTTVFAFSKSQIPIYIEIGLFFDGTAKSTVFLKSNTGFEVGKYYQNHFEFLTDFLNYNEIILRKDTYYIGSNSNYVEYTGNINGNTQNIHGPYHVQIGDIFTTKSEAQEFINDVYLGNIGDKPYLVYEGGWKVFIGLYLQQEDAESVASKISNLSGEITKIILPSNTRVQVLDIKGMPIFMYDSKENVYFQGFSDKGVTPLVNVEGKQYRGGITAKRIGGSDMSIVNKVLLEEYLYGVVPSEMPATWSLEALKAQAVIARGYAVANMNRFKNSGFDLCNTTRSQVYGGYDKEHPNSNRAVEETRGKVLLYNGEIVNAFYHANSGGHTENSENVWSQPLPYIRGVKDDFSLGHQNSSWSQVFKKSEIIELLESNNIYVGEVIDIKVTSVSENGRVMELTVYGTNGQETLIKEKSRNILGLKSTWFTVSGGGNGLENSDNIIIKNSTRSTNTTDLVNKYLISSSGFSQIRNSSNIKIYNGTNYRKTTQASVTPTDTFVFHGKGFGHGLGMSQWGAKKMAEEGYNYIEILSHYYTGVEVE